jgi:hypothetical protein
MDKKEELLQQIQKIKHNYSKLIPTTIELMFDACLGILYEDFATKRAALDAREKAAGGPKSLKLGLLRANDESKLKRDRELVEYLKKRVTSIYTEVMNESEKNKENRSKGESQPDGPSTAPSGGEGSSGG